MISKAILEIYGSPNNQYVNLFLPSDAWKEIVKKLKTNRLEVVLRILETEYQGDLNLK